jgi:hypothetical protein
MPTTAATALAGLSRLDADTQRFAEAALQLAEMAEISERAVQKALVGLEAARDREIRGTGLVDVFDASLSDAAKALPNPAARVAFGSDYLLLRASDRSRDAPDALMAKHFGGATLTGLRALTDRMTADRIAQVFDRVGSDNSGIDDMLVGQFDLQMFACQEDMEINGTATIPFASVRLREEFGWPEDLTAELEKGMDMAMYGPCAEFERHPRPGMNDPVTSDFPLWFCRAQGAPSQGHITFRHQPCGLDVALTAELPPGHFQSPVPRSRSFHRMHETGSRPELSVCVKRPLCARYDQYLGVGLKQTFRVPGWSDT